MCGLIWGYMAENNHLQRNPHQMKYSNSGWLLLLFIFILILSICLSGCGTFKAARTESQILNPKTYYRHDIKIKEKISGRKGHGVLTVPRQAKYKFEFKTPGAIDAIIITTCAGQFSTEDIKSGWLSKGRKFEYTYEPKSEMQTLGSCQIRVEAFEKGVDSRHSTGLIEFETPQSGETLKANIVCNMDFKAAYSSFVCQSYGESPEKALLQQIKFFTPVELMQEAIPERCRIPEPKDGMNWIFKIRNRECLYSFRAEDKQYFRLQMVGYEKIPLRGD